MALGLVKLLAVAALVAAAAAAQLCPCPKHYFPMCGSDGITYGNQCTFQCAQGSKPYLTLRYKGRCRERRATDECVCTKNLKPVCGSNNITYSNECLLKCASKTNRGIELAHSGPCVEEKKAENTCFCTMIYSPQCGSDGITYGNECTLNCARNSKRGLILSHPGECFDADD